MVPQQIDVEVVDDHGLHVGIAFGCDGVASELDVGGGVELAGLLARGVGEVLDQVFVGGAKQVGELEVLVAQRDLLEVLDEVR